MPEIENRAPVKKRGNPAWRKGGASPNPGGRPKAVADLLNLARASVPDALELAAKLMANPRKDARVRLDAAKLILAYGLGRPAAVDSDEKDKGAERPLVGVDVAQLLEILRAGANGPVEKRNPSAAEH